MRLIDADELKALRGVAIYATDEKTDTQIITASVYRRADIDNAPTVEAIPISWLEDYLKGVSFYGEYRHIPGYIYTMIDNWRTEQCAKQQNTTSE